MTLQLPAPRSRTARIQTARALTLLTAAALVAGPASTSHALLDKTRFAAHVGAAYYAFHHWVLAPYRAGTLASGQPGQTGRLIKGGLALLFAAHEINVAEKIARASHDPLLQKLDAGLDHLKTSFSKVGATLRGGGLNAADLTALGTETASLGTAAAAAGQPIRDVAAPIPGL